MSQSSDSSTRALATLVTALGITIGATPATLRAQAPAKTPTREAVQSKHKEVKPEAVQIKVETKEAVQLKRPTKEAVQDKQVTAKEAVQSKVRAKEAAQIKHDVKAPAATPAQPS